ncbi:hypothetical protein FGL91_13985 [Microbacterium sp. CBA3102]|uniref:hypothetical protein n=1 Tax=Microbacterium sp. CBA3102 TaxID=2603598 RepID=UPI0011BB31B4|nr:hypothetical protein [Microbacterium sp. CBA3102]QEA29566.1 hypothetical protein FGL91_13985 [Microbacterium sp. CBA3102]
MSTNGAANVSTAGDEGTSRPEIDLRTLTIAQFFVGGFVLFVAAVIVGTGMIASGAGGNEYDGAMSLIGIVFSGVLVAAPSMVLAMVIGLPIRLVPALRSRWLANGAITVAGAVVGFIALIGITAALAVSPGEGGASAAAVLWGLLAIAWGVFALSVAHFVWPVQWLRGRVKASPYET